MNGTRTKKKGREVYGADRVDALLALIDAALDENEAARKAA